MILENIKCLIADWDETITAHDTLSLVAQAAYHHKPGFEPHWGYFGENYLSDFLAYSDQFNKERGNRNSLNDEGQFLRGQLTVELISIDRVEKSGLFYGVPQSEIQKQASHVQVREGWWDLMRQAKQLGIPVIVLSVNWSRIFIEEVFKLNGFDKDAAPRIYANEVEMTPDLVGTGRLRGINREIRSAHDKLDVIKEIRKEYDADARICYFGDSGTDLLALLEADIGIIVHKNSLLNRCRHLGIEVCDVGDGTKQDDEDNDYSRAVIYGQLERQNMLEDVNAQQEAVDAEIQGSQRNHNLYFINDFAQVSL